jgi:hypothetical protein
VAFEAQVLTYILEKLEIDQVRPISFPVSSDPDNLYLHEVMKQPDTDQFVKAMSEEIQAYEGNHHLEVKTRDVISPGTPILPAIWSMREKGALTQVPFTNGKQGKQEHGINN